MFSNRNKTQSNEFELVNFFCRVYIKRFFSREGGLLLRNDLIVIRFPFSDFRWVLWCNKLSTVSRWTTPSVCDFARFFDRYVSRRQVDTVETVTINNKRGAERERERKRERFLGRSILKQPEKFQASYIFNRPTFLYLAAVQLFTSSVRIRGRKS